MGQDDDARTHVVRYEHLARVVLGCRPLLGATRLVAVDGPSGAGKSYFANRLAEAIYASGAAAPVVHTDDVLEGWADQISFWPRLEQWVLQPLRNHETGGFHPYDWVAAQRSDTWIGIPAAPVLIVEGVSAAREQISDELSLSVFVTAPAPLRITRTVHRDGGELLPFMERWRWVEEDFFARDRTSDRADLVVDGTPSGEVTGPEEFTIVSHGAGRPTIL